MRTVAADLCIIFQFRKWSGMKICKANDQQKSAMFHHLHNSQRYSPIISPFMLCVRQKLNNTVDLTNVGMLACYPEQLFGSHLLNRDLRYVNDLGDEPFGYEEIDDCKKIEIAVK